MTTGERLAPNALVPCPSESSRKRHLAKAEHCSTCGTEGRTVPLPSLHIIVLRRRELRAIRGAA